MFTNKKDVSKTKNKHKTHLKINTSLNNIHNNNTNNKDNDVDYGDNYAIINQPFSLSHQIQKDSVINNYNVKVNITKKKTKNISIGNLTLNNTKIRGNIFLDQITRKSVNVSPRNTRSENETNSNNYYEDNNSNNNNNFFLNQLTICNKNNKSCGNNNNNHLLQEIKNANSVLNSPKHSYNKIISTP
jgi:hypothetical protein